MTIFSVLAVALAGALGAVCRHLLSSVVKVVTRGRWFSPALATVCVNMTGCFATGIFAGLIGNSGLFPNAQLWLVIGTGLLGGFSTFSTAVLDAVDLMRAHHAVTGVALAFGILFAGIGVALLGLALTGAV